MRYKLLLLFFAPLLLFSQENGILKEYDRSSLSVMMIFHPEDEFAHNICEAFFTMPFPDKYARLGWHVGEIKEKSEGCAGLCGAPLA